MFFGKRWKSDIDRLEENIIMIFIFPPFPTNKNTKQQNARKQRYDFETINRNKISQNHIQKILSPHTFQTPKSTATHT